MFSLVITHMPKRPVCVFVCNNCYLGYGNQRHVHLLQLGNVLDDEQLRQDIGDLRRMLFGVLAQLRQILDGLAANLQIGIFAQIELGIDGHVHQVREKPEEFADKLRGEPFLFVVTANGGQDLLIFLLMLQTRNDD